VETGIRRYASYRKSAKYSQKLLGMPNLSQTSPREAVTQKIRWADVAAIQYSTNVQAGGPLQGLTTFSGSGTSLGIRRLWFLSAKEPKKRKMDIGDYQDIVLQMARALGGQSCDGSWSHT
jgi:hypothetical protein